MEKKRNLDKITYGRGRGGYDSLLDYLNSRHTAECFESNGKIGISIDGEELIPALYDKIILAEIHGMFQSSFYAVVGNKIESEQKMKWGILSNQNKLIADIIYDNVRFYKYYSFDSYSSTIILTNGNKHYCISISEDVPIIEIDDYSYVGDFISFKNFSHIPEIRRYLRKNQLEDRKYAIVKKQNKYGIIMDNGVVLIEPEVFVGIEKLMPIQENGVYKYRALATTQGGHNVYIDHRGYLHGIIPPVYIDIIQLTEDRYVVQNSDKKWGVINKRNKIICNFDFIDYYQNREPSFHSEPNKTSAIFVTEKGKVLLDLKTGKTISDYYEGIIWIDNNSFCRIEKEGKFGLMAANGDIYVPCIYEQIYKVHINEKGCQAKDVKLDGVHGKIINGEFKPVIDYQEERKCNSRKTNPSKDRPTYERYAGSYAQDEAGYSDDDIDTIFDGDPNAYWNID